MNSSQVDHKWIEISLTYFYVHYLLSQPCVEAYLQGASDSDLGGEVVYLHCDYHMVPLVIARRTQLKDTTSRPCSNKHHQVTEACQGVGSVIFQKVEIFLKSSD